MKIRVPELTRGVVVLYLALAGLFGLLCACIGTALYDQFLGPAG